MLRVCVSSSSQAPFLNLNTILARKKAQLTSDSDSSTVKIRKFFATSRMPHHTANSKHSTHVRAANLLSIINLVSLLVSLNEVYSARQYMCHPRRGDIRRA